MTQARAAYHAWRGGVWVCFWVLVRVGVRVGWREGRGGLAVAVLVLYGSLWLWLYDRRPAGRN